MSRQYLYPHLNYIPNWASEPGLLRGFFHEEIVQILENISTGIPPEGWVDDGIVPMMTTLQRVEYVLSAANRTIWVLGEEDTMADFNASFYELLAPEIQREELYAEAIDRRLDSLDTLVAMMCSTRGDATRMLKHFTLSTVAYLMNFSARTTVARQKSESQRLLLELTNENRGPERQGPMARARNALWEFLGRWLGW
ncbi:hypothetical protein PFICI_00685 [Pestalotiopsis fici W106-1]|uniref:Uncharacterized protein n=1 Tax=Pestalotiopsis fici (strain W106-1 / CGMCC3.15140) TaxID=1229662 RepID=W3XMX1_PESFW|nr:uncharacterized protein PFICI_00685 [Pestalotiopsis fici W106-1]ETS86857.1 hypothetical protein PFICI_00685 [Pestalotiopsis fici W106-1]